MKYLRITIIVLLTFSVFCSCSKQKSETVKESSYIEKTENSQDDEYTEALKMLNLKAYRTYCDSSSGSLEACFIDVNSDGFDDVIFGGNCVFPLQLYVYESGHFIFVDTNSEVYGGSIFPSGEKSGYFIDKGKGIIVIRYGGHTDGTRLSIGAEAYKINGTEAESLWILYSNPEKYCEKYPEVEDSDKCYSECFEEFDTEYTKRTADYSLVNYFDYCKEWKFNEDDGSELCPMYCFSVMKDIAWADNYKNYLLEKISNVENQDRCNFSLCYIDGDSIPELVFTEHVNNTSETTVVSYKNGTLTEADPIGTSGGFWYEELTGKIITQYGKQGSATTIVCEYCDGKITKKDDLTNTFTDPEKMTDYISMVNDEKVDTEMFSEKYYNIVPYSLIFTGFVGIDEEFPNYTKETRYGDFCGPQSLDLNTVNEFFDGIGNGKSYGANYITATNKDLLNFHWDYIEEFGQ